MDSKEALFDAAAAEEEKPTEVEAETIPNPFLTTDAAYPDQTIVVSPHDKRQCPLPKGFLWELVEGDAVQGWSVKGNPEKGDGKPKAIPVKKMITSSHAFDYAPEPYLVTI